MKTYIEPTQEAGRDFFMRGIQAEVVMLKTRRSFIKLPRHSDQPSLGHRVIDLATLVHGTKSPWRYNAGG